MYREQFYQHEDLRHLKNQPGISHIVPAVAIGAGLAAGGLAGSIFGKKKIPTYDVSGINRLIEQGGQEQRRTIGQIRPETQKLLDTFQGSATAAQDKANAARAAEKTNYLKEIDPVQSRLLQNQTDQLKRTTFGAIPEAQQATREALAASGGLNRGVSAESLAKVPLQAAQQFSEGAAGLQQTALKNQQDVLANLHSEESSAIAKNLGIDEDTYNTILNTGDSALMAELNGLIEESKNRNQGLINAEQFRQTGNVASAAADNANQQAIYSSLTNLGGNLMGAGMGGLPAASGASAVNPTAGGYTPPPGYQLVPIARRSAVLNA